MSKHTPGPNLHLIAAAPDLLEALESLFEHCAMIHKHWGEGDNMRQADAAIQRGRAAIAKAKGRNEQPVSAPDLRTAIKRMRTARKAKGTS